MKVLRVLGVLAVLLGLAVVPAAAAPDAPPGKWVTDFTVLNLENQPATVEIVRYNQCVGACTPDSGTSVASTVIPANGSYYYNPVSDPAFPAGFSGSIVLSSDRLLGTTVTIANDGTGNAYASDAYSGISEVSPSVFLPIIMGKLGPWNTRIAVQNAGTAATNVTIRYIGSGAPADTVITNLPPNMMALVDQLNNPGMSNFNGSAVVTADQPLAVEVDEYKSTGGVLISYVGVPSSQADSVIYMPGYIAQGTWATDFTIVNTEAAAANIQITFAKSALTMSGTIAANGSAYINGYAGVKPAGWTGAAPVSGYYGSATVTSTNGKKLVVVYNIANSGGGPGNRQMGYVGFPATLGATKIAVPLIENMYSTGWNTTFSVQKIEAGSADLQMSYSGNKLANCSPCTYSITDAEQAHTFNQVTDGHIPTGFLGGVVITSNKKIVVIADQDKNSTVGDTAAGFPGLAVPVGP